MTSTITTDVVEAYSLCPRKAFLLMAKESSPGPHEYEQITDERATAGRQVHRASLEEAGELPLGFEATDLSNGAKVLVDAKLETSGLQAQCDFLTKVSEPRASAHSG